MASRYRWWIGTLLFLSTVINYLDRQTLSVLGPHLKLEFHWSNSDFALILIAFRVAYAVLQAVSGRVMDRLGTRLGLSLAVTWYSVAAIATSAAVGLKSFCAFRFLLGAGEAANWPAATKAVSEWFPRRERGWAVALFDSGSSIGAALAPWLVLLILGSFGNWRACFAVIGLLGFGWLLLWRMSYHPPETHPRLSDAERRLIFDDRRAEEPNASLLADSQPPAYLRLLGLRQTWAAILSRTLTDPVWFMITDWFAIYLAAKGFLLEQMAAGFWVPFLAADLGNFFGGGFSSYLIQSGWGVGRARKALIAGGGIGVLALIPAAFLSSFPGLVACFALATFSYAVFSTMALSLPADLFHSRAVGSVAGLAGSGAGLGTIASTYLIGAIADRFSFQPILIAASVVPLFGASVVIWLLRNTPASGGALVKVI